MVIQKLIAWLLFATVFRKILVVLIIIFGIFFTYQAVSGEQSFSDVTNKVVAFFGKVVDTLVKVVENMFDTAMGTNKTEKKSEESEGTAADKPAG